MTANGLKRLLKSSDVRGHVVARELQPLSQLRKLGIAAWPPVLQAIAFDILQ